MSTSDSGMYRVAIHADTARADLTLPSGVPVAALIAAVADLIPHRAGPESLRPYRLAEPGRAALDGTKTLSQQGIRDGSILLLTHAEYRAPRVLFDDPAEQVAAAVRTKERPWDPPARRLSAALAASALAGVAGFVAIPGGPGSPNALLAAAAAGTVALMSVPPSGCSAPVRTTLCCLAGLAVLAAVAGMAAAVTGIAPTPVGAVAAAAGVGMIRIAGRMVSAATGLARREAQVGAAHDLLTGLVAGAAALVPLGAAAVVAGTPASGAPRLVGAVFAATAGVALTLRARSHTDGVQIAALIAGGTATLGIALLGAARNTAAQWPVAAAALLVAVVLGLGFAAPGVSPLIGRGAEVIEGLALGSLAPLACWLCGLYSVARGLSLG